MKKTLIIGAAAAALLAAPAMAADLPAKAPVRAPAVVAPAAYNWTGFYIGADVGYGWEYPTVTATGNDPVSAGVLAGGFVGGNTALGPASFATSGVFGGVEGGYNWQVNRSWLLGIEVDFNAADINGQGSAISSLNATTQQQLAAARNVSWFGTVRPRLGWLATDNLLLYGTGGFAYGRVHDTVNYGINGTISGVSQFGGYGFGCPQNFGPCMGGTSTRVATGWTAGGGGEYRVPGTNVSLKAEYLYVNLGRGNVITGVSPVIPVFANLPSSMSFAFSQIDFHTAKVGLNWHF
jgi:outer membrane immunogenic protein